MARKTKEDAQLTKDAILNAAMDVIFKKGLSYVTMADIADAANVSRGAVYGHYKGKVEVALAMCQRAVEQLQPLDKHTEESCLQYLYRLGLHQLRLAVEPSDIQRVLFILYTKIDDEESLMALRREWELAYLSQVHHWLLEAVRNKELPADLNHEFAATYLQALLDGIFCMVYWYSHGDAKQWAQGELLFQVGFETLQNSPRFRLESPHSQESAN